MGAGRARGVVHCTCGGSLVRPISLPTAHLQCWSHDTDSPTNNHRYDWSQLTTVAWNDDPQLVCASHAAGARVVLSAAGVPHGRRKCGTGGKLALSCSARVSERPAAGATAGRVDVVTRRGCLHPLPSSLSAAPCTRSRHGFTLCVWQPHGAHSVAGRAAGLRAAALFGWHKLRLGEGRWLGGACIACVGGGRRQPPRQQREDQQQWV